MTSLALSPVAVTIRPFVQDDAASVEFVVLSVLQEWGFLPSARDQQELEKLQSQNPFEVFFVAETPDIGVVGSAGIVRLDDTTCELRKIYLLKRFRKNGYGQMMLEACVQAAQDLGFKRMRFEVNSAMSTDFYARNQFVIAPEESPQSPSADQVYYKAL